MAKNITYSTRADFFSNYVDDPQNIDVFWTNVLHLKVNNWLIVNYNFDLIYDDDVKLFGEENIIKLPPRCVHSWEWVLRQSLNRLIFL